MKPTLTIYSPKMLALMAIISTQLILPEAASAAEKCVKATNKVVAGKVVTSLSTVTRPTSCKTGEVPVLAGPPGPAGPDAQLQVYGNGSAGILNVTQHGELFKNYAADGNLQFSSITISAGKVLYVPNGTELRASGDVTINGSIFVQYHNLGGLISSGNGAYSLYGAFAYRPPTLGIARSAAGIGELGSASANRVGGSGGLGIGGAALTINDNLLRGGGGGAPGSEGPFAVGGVAGGSLMIKAGGTITVNGSITANAPSLGGINGGGGGGGGVVVLASTESIAGSGEIQARGATGCPGSSQAASGGGGGGGLIILAAPSVSMNQGLLTTMGGAGGNSRNAGSITANPRMGGGGGGGSYGDGGDGATAKPDGSSSAGQNGNPGKTLILEVDPTGLL